MSTDDFQFDSAELDSLKTKLSQVQTKLVHQWMGADLASTVEEQKRRHEAQMKKSQEELAALKENLAKLKNQANVNQTVIAEKVSKMRTMKDELEEIDKETDNMLREKEAAQRQMETLHEELAHARELLSTQDQVTRQKQEELEKAAEWYSDRLAFNFKKISGSRIQMIFTCVDENDPARPFFFSMKVEESGSYTVSDCSHPVADIDELVKKLNETNNLRSFIIVMRQRFRGLV